MIYDTILPIEHIRQDLQVPSRLVTPIIMVGELKAFALKTDWDIQKVRRKDGIINDYSTADIELEITLIYAQTDAFSQGKLKNSSLGNSTRNMRKNNIWIEAIALCLDMELHTTDNDFDHLPATGLRLMKH